MNYVVAPTESYEAIGAAYERYVCYLDERWESLPSGLQGFVKEPWYYMFTDHRCPHDGIFRSLSVTQEGLELAFFTWKHGTLTTFCYTDVLEFKMTVPRNEEQDAPVSFLFDEFNVFDDAQFSHEILGSNGSRVYVRFRGDVVLQQARESR